MRQKFSLKLLLVIVAVVVVVVGGYVGLHSKKSSTQKTSLTTAETHAPTVTFTGKVVAINNGCKAGGRCSFIVDKRLIISGGGLSKKASENIWGSVDSAAKVGDVVSVKAIPSPKDPVFTLQGCKDCYIKKAAQ